MFCIRLEVVASEAQSTITTELPDLEGYDDATSVQMTILHDICENLQEQGDVKFSIDGFNGALKYLDIGFDLSSVLQQFSDLKTWLDNPENSQCIFDLFEQGTEARIKFNLIDGVVEATHMDRKKVTDVVIIEHVGLSELRQQFAKLIEVFSTLGETRFPNHFRSQPFQDWLATVVG